MFLADLHIRPSSADKAFELNDVCRDKNSLKNFHDLLIMLRNLREKNFRTLAESFSCINVTIFSLISFH